jgi:tRNA A-37 threonylcarbamoyl transferase component Bud32
MKVALATGTVAAPEKPGFTPPAIEELARKFPQLEIIELIGRGGMGAVYKARQKELDRIVALKILPPGIGDDAAFAERFAREAKALARLNHPGIITIHDFGRADGLYFFVMEFVDGVNLRQLLASSRVSPREALAIVPQICDALQFAHDQGIVHRDIKPENILLDRRGRVKVADFGLAKIVEGSAGSPLPAESGSGTSDGAHGASRPASELTDAGKVLGTPAYMAPEQVEHPAEVDHRADIYALGVVFYQMLTGELPGKSLEPPSKKVQIDVRLDEVVLRALEKKPELRYQQVSEVKTIVETIAGTAEVLAVEPGVGKGLPIGRALTKEEAEELGRDLARLFTRQGLPSFAKRTLLWFANQALLLFDLFATWPVFVERAGRRRFSLWLFLLMFSSTIGFGVYGELLAINLAQGLWHATPPALALQEWQMFQLMVLFAVARLAGLNLGLKEVARAGSAQTAIAITPRRVVRVLLTLMGLAALVFGTALAGNWLTTIPSSALTNITHGAPKLAIIIGFILLVVVGWSLWVFGRVWRVVREKTEESASSDGLPAVEAWLALIDRGDYAQSWETAAAYFQRKTGEEEWVRQMEHLRRPLGKVRSRKPRPPKFSAGWTSFGAQFAFATSFDGLPAATETVTFARQKPNGEWRAIGYLIEPRA